MQRHHKKNLYNSIKTEQFVLDSISSESSGQLGPKIII